MDKTTSFGLPFFYRVALPGGIATILLMPVLSRAFKTLGIAATDYPFAYVAVALVAGVVLAALDASMYEIFEGRRFWPNWLYQFRTRRWQAHVNRLHERQAKLPRTDWRFVEVWDQLRRFPRDSEGAPTATRPTQLGNVLASYEDYPEKLYGLHPVPYWPRLWLLLDKDVRDEIDRGWAPTDGLMYVAASLLFIGVAYPVLAVASAVAATTGLQLFFFSDDERVVAAYGGLLLAFASWIPYQLSLSGHMENGDTMKAMFDAFRHLLKDVKTPVDDGEKRINRRRGTWMTYGVPPADD